MSEIMQTAGHGMKDIRYMTIDDTGEKTAYSNLISYRVLKALYEVLKKIFTWNECFQAMKQSQKLRDAAVAIIHRSMRAFYENNCFDFDVQDVVLTDFLPESERGDMVVAVKLYDDEYGVRLIESFLIRSEMAHYRLLRQRGEMHSWEEYLEALIRQEPLREKLLAGFRDGLMRLDLKGGWLSNDVAELTDLLMQ